MNVKVYYGELQDKESDAQNAESSAMRNARTYSMLTAYNVSRLYHYMLCILTGEWVLRTLLPCQNLLFSVLTSFSFTNKKKSKKKHKEGSQHLDTTLKF